MLSTAALQIMTARKRLAVALARRAALDALLDARYPAPAEPCDDATFDAWNDAYEDARCEAGGYAADREVREAEAALIQIVREALPHDPDADVAFAAALGERSPMGFVVARRRVLELCHRLDVSTL
jgi:hypothetical protein